MTRTFIGREDELELLLTYVAAGRRLTTVVGPPGVGKTTVVQQLLARVDGDALFCDLSTAHDASQMLHTAARALGQRPSADHDFEEAVDAVAQSLLERGPLLLVLDNFEQVTEAAPTVVAPWLMRAPELQVVVTSRHRLHLAGEYVFELEPLAQDDAVALFEARALMTRRTFEAEPNRDLVRQLVEQLDRLPLAIELAAARVGTADPADLLDRIDQRFRMLRSRAHDKPARQATLEAAIAWSWDLLSEHDRTVLARCSVFRGGFSLRAAEQVLASDWVVDDLEDLRAKSLLVLDTGQHGRFRMLASIREFAARELGADEATSERHAAYFAEVGQAMLANLNGPGGYAVLTQLEVERANLLRAFDWARERDATLALTIAAVLDEMLRFGGLAQEYEQFLDAACAVAKSAEDDDALTRFSTSMARHYVAQGRLDEATATLVAVQQIASDAARGWVQLRLGEVLRTRGEFVRGLEELEVALRIAGDVGDEMLRRSALVHLANCQVDLRRVDDAMASLATVDFNIQTEDLRAECELLKRCAYVHYYLENYDEQHRLNEAALAMAVELGDRRLEGMCLQSVGDSAFAQGQYEDAIEHYVRALRIHETFGSTHYEAMLLGSLGGSYHRCAQPRQARECYKRSLDLHRQTGALPYEGVVAFAIGALEHESANMDDAYFHYDRALDIARQLEQPSDIGALLLCRTWLDLERSDATAEPLRDAVAQANDAFATSDTPTWQAICEATRGVIERRLGCPDAAQQHFDAARELATESCGLERRLVDALDTGVISAQDARQSLYMRLVQRLHGVSLTEASEIESQPLLRLGPDLRWFECEDAPRVDLRRRRSLRLVLAHLVENHEATPGQGSEAFTVFDAGWPDEEIHPDQALERVYWAIRTLRKLGLEELLITSDDGYHLHTQLQIDRDTAP